MESERRRAEDPDDCREFQNRSMRWRVLKEISIPTLVALAVQTAGGIWWAATMSAKVDSLENTLRVAQAAQTATDARQDADAIRAESRISAQLERLNTKLDRLIETREYQGVPQHRGLK